MCVLHVSLMYLCVFLSHTMGNSSLAIQQQKAYELLPGVVSLYNCLVITWCCVYVLIL